VSTIRQSVEQKVVTTKRVTCEWLLKIGLSVLFARAPRRAGRDVGALCATKSRTLPQIHFGKDNIGDSISVFSSRKIGTFSKFLMDKIGIFAAKNSK